MGGDFHFLSFLQLNGIIGLLIFFVILVVNMNRLNWLPATIFLLGTLHYGVIFYFPGQFFFGYLLALRSSSSNLIDIKALKFSAKII